MLSDIYDASFNRMFSEKELREALAQIYGVNPELIFIRVDRDDWNGITKETKLTCTQEVVGGDFPVVINLWGSVYHSFEDQEEPISKICDFLSAKALVPAYDDPDTSVYHEISGFNKRRYVEIKNTIENGLRILGYID